MPPSSPSLLLKQAAGDVYCITEVYSRRSHQQLCPPTTSGSAHHVLLEQLIYYWFARTNNKRPNVSVYPQGFLEQFHIFQYLCLEQNIHLYPRQSPQKGKRTPKTQAILMYSMLENISSHRARRSRIDFHMFTDSSNFKLYNFKTACQSLNFQLLFQH